MTMTMNTLNEIASTLTDRAIYLANRVRTGRRETRLLALATPAKVYATTTSTRKGASLPVRLQHSERPLGMSGRQWKKLYKAEQRARRVLA